MEITILDLINLKKLEGMKLLAGKNGLNRRVKGCGILDYELDSSLKDKYSYDNFKEGQFVLTSFLYAKDDEHLIGEALKYLVDKKVSCLAIKNIYSLRLHDYMLRYADSKDFPIFIIENPHIYFEDVIVTIDECNKNMARLDYGHREIDFILNKSPDNASIKRYAYKINPSLVNRFFTVYFYFNEDLNFYKFNNIISKYKLSKFYSPQLSLLRYGNGLMMIYSNEHMEEGGRETIINDMMEQLGISEYSLSIGVSKIHHYIYKMKEALNESIYASMLNKSLALPLTLYEKLGSYGAIFPFAREEGMKNFSREILKPIQDYDAENKLKLTETLIEYIQYNGDLNKVSNRLSLHENTIRNRMEKIGMISGLDFKKIDHYEQLALAVKIHICNDLFDEFSHIN